MHTDTTDPLTGLPRTHRATVLSTPTATQQRRAREMLAGDVLAAVREGAARGLTLPAALTAMTAALRGEAVSERTARRVVEALSSIGCRAHVEAV